MFNFLMILIAPVPLWPDFGRYFRPTVGQLFAWPDFGRFFRPTVGKSLRTVVLSDLLGCVPGGRNPDVENDRKKILTTFVTA